MSGNRFVTSRIQIKPLSFWARMWSGVVDTWKGLFVGEGVRRPVFLVVAFFLASLALGAMDGYNNAIAVVKDIWPYAIPRHRVLVVLPAEPKKESRDMKEGILDVFPDSKIHIDSGGTPINIDVVFVAEGPEPTDTSKRLLEEVRSKKPLLVIGHSSSSSAVPACESVYVPLDIPAILLAPTTPSITQRAAERGSYCIMRMLPTDRFQAKGIARRVQAECLKWHSAYSRISIAELDRHRRGRPYRVLVVSDSSNLAYSDYLTLRIVEELRTASESIEKSIEDASFFRLLPDAVAETSVHKIQISTSLVSPTSMANADWDTMLRMRPQFVVFVGMTDAARLFWETWAMLSVASGDPYYVANDKTRNHKPVILFTDGCSTTDFSDFIARNYSKSTDHRRADQMPWETVLISTPMVAIGGRVNYKPLGQAAALFALKTLQKSSEESNRWTFGTDEVLKFFRRLQTEVPSLSIKSTEVSFDTELEQLVFRDSDLSSEEIVRGDNSGPGWRFMIYRADGGVFRVDEMSAPLSPGNDPHSGSSDTPVPSERRRE